MSRKKKNKIASRSSIPVQNPIPKSVQERQLRTLRQVQLSARMTTGPIPSAEELLRYQQVQPDLPERIMRQFERRTDMAEKQSEHRMTQEHRVIGNNILMERLGWFSATLLGLVVLGGSIWLISTGKSVEGLAGVVVSLASLLGLYIFGRKDQVQEVTKKRAADLVKQGVTPEQLNLLPGEPE
jgi:uncharacterized membrane protein